MIKKDKDIVSSAVVSKKERITNYFVFALLVLGAIVMVFPLIYMVMTSFMTKNQILSGQLSIFPNPWVFGKYGEVLRKGNFISGILNTIKVEIPVLLIGGFTSSLAAFSFAKLKFRGKGALEGRTCELSETQILKPHLALHDQKLWVRDPGISVFNKETVMHAQV